MGRWRHATLGSPAEDRTRVLIPVLALAVLAYVNAGAGTFQFDDFGVIVDNPRVHTLPQWLAGIRAGSPRPLLSLSYLLCWLAGEGRPWPFHLVNLGIHLLTVVLVAALGQRFLEATGQPASARRLALLGALLFAIHPAHTEAVTYLSGRSTALMTLCYLAALWLHDRGGLRAGADRQPQQQALVLLAWLAAVLSKEAAVMLPLTLLLWDLMIGVPRAAMLARHRLYWLCLLPLAGLMALHPAYGGLAWKALHVRSLADQVGLQAEVTWTLASRLLLPWQLDIDPDWTHAASPALGYFALLAWLGTALLAWRVRRRQPVIAFALAWLVLHLFLPYLLFARADVANERQLYWADWPVFLAAMQWLDRAPGGRRASLVAAALVCALVVLTVQRNALYADPVLLWQDTAAKSPFKGRVINNLGYALQLAGRKDEARAAYRQALALEPTLLRAQNNLQRLDAMTGSGSSQ